jgi:hypothetical protein
MSGRVWRSAEAEAVRKVLQESPPSACRSLKDCNDARRQAEESFARLMSRQGPFGPGKGKPRG